MFKKWRLRRKRRREGLFIIHGFTGSPTSGFGDLKIKLEINGINHEMPFLQGHRPEDDINEFDPVKCLEEIEQKYLTFKKKYDKVHILGYSMGGVIAAHLENLFGADKLILVAPAFKFGLVGKVVDKVIRRKKREDVIDSNKPDEITQMLIMEVMGDGNNEINKNPTLATYRNFTRLVSQINKQLRPIESPTRIYISDEDKVIPLASAEYIFDLVNNNDKSLKIITGVGHNVLASHLKDQLVLEIFDFLFERQEWSDYNKVKMLKTRRKLYEKKAKRELEKFERKEE